MNNNKKKITTVVLLLAFLAIAVTGGTLAYFTDTDSATHTYTAGNVEIDLTEGAVVKNDSGNYVFIDRINNRIDVGANEEDEYDFGKLYPAMTIAKDPTITNLGSENAYIAAKVTITSAGDLYEILGLEGYDIIDINTVVDGGLSDQTVNVINNYCGTSLVVHGNNEFAVYQEADRQTNTYVLYFFIEDAKATNEEVVLFEQLTIPSTWDNAEMAQLENLKITVDAFATQEYGFASCYDAMTTAFGGQNGEFNFN